MTKAMVTSRDPVCGMDVEVARSALFSTHRGIVYHFCSAQCLERFNLTGVEVRFRFHRAGAITLVRRIKNERFQRRLRTIVLSGDQFGIYCAIEADPAIALLLPCNVVAREGVDGNITVAFLDTEVVLQLRQTGSSCSCQRGRGTAATGLFEPQGVMPEQEGNNPGNEWH